MDRKGQPNQKKATGRRSQSASPEMDQENARPLDPTPSEAPQPLFESTRDTRADQSPPTRRSESANPTNTRPTPPLTTDPTTSTANPKRSQSPLRPATPLATQKATSRDTAVALRRPKHSTHQAISDGNIWESTSMGTRIAQIATGNPGIANRGNSHISFHANPGVEKSAWNSATTDKQFSRFAPRTIVQGVYRFEQSQGNPTFDQMAYRNPKMVDISTSSQWQTGDEPETNSTVVHVSADNWNIPQGAVPKIPPAAAKWQQPKQTITAREVRQDQPAQPVSLEPAVTIEDANDSDDSISSEAHNNMPAPNQYRTSMEQEIYMMDENEKWDRMRAAKLGIPYTRPYPRNRDISETRREQQGTVHENSPGIPTARNNKPRITETDPRAAQIADMINRFEKRNPARSTGNRQPSEPSTTQKSSLYSQMAAELNRIEKLELQEAIQASLRDDNRIPRQISPRYRRESTRHSSPIPEQSRQHQPRRDQDSYDESQPDYNREYQHHEEPERRNYNKQRSQEVPQTTEFLDKLNERSQRAFSPRPRSERRHSPEPRSTKEEYSGGSQRPRRENRFRSTEMPAGQAQARFSPQQNPTHDRSGNSSRYSDAAFPGQKQNLNYTYPDFKQVKPDRTVYKPKEDPVILMMKNRAQEIIYQQANLGGYAVMSEDYNREKAALTRSITNSAKASQKTSMLIEIPECPEHGPPWDAKTIQSSVGSRQEDASLAIRICFGMAKPFGMNINTLVQALTMTLPIEASMAWTKMVTRLPVQHALQRLVKRFVTKKSILDYLDEKRQMEFHPKTETIHMAMQKYETLLDETDFIDNTDSTEAREQAKRQQLLKLVGPPIARKIELKMIKKLKKGVEWDYDDMADYAHELVTTSEQPVQHIGLHAVQTRSRAKERPFSPKERLRSSSRERRDQARDRSRNKHRDIQPTDDKEDKSMDQSTNVFPNIDPSNMEAIKIITAPKKGKRQITDVHSGQTQEIEDKDGTSVVTFTTTRDAAIFINKDYQSRGRSRYKDGNYSKNKTNSRNSSNNNSRNSSNSRSNSRNPPYDRPNSRSNSQNGRYNNNRSRSFDPKRFAKYQSN